MGATMSWGSESTEAEAILDQIRGFSVRATTIELTCLIQLRLPASLIFVEEALGPVTALVMAHCQSVDSNIYTTSIESFNLHFAINVRATWLLIREFGMRCRGGHGNGRIVSITSDHTVGNLPYGASKGAMDRIVLAATHELKDLGIRPKGVGATCDTSWAGGFAARLRKPGEVPVL